MTTRALHFDDGPEPSKHHAFRTTINGEEVSDYGAWLHSQQSDDGDPHGLPEVPLKRTRNADQAARAADLRRGQGDRTDWLALLRTETAHLAVSTGRNLKAIPSVTLDRTTGSKARSIMRGKSMAKAGARRSGRTPVVFRHRDMTRAERYDMDRLTRRIEGFDHDHYGKQAEAKRRRQDEIERMTVYSPKRSAYFDRDNGETLHALADGLYAFLTSENPY